MLWLFISILIIIFILLYSEYVAHDCVPKPGKECTHNCDIPDIKLSPELYIDGVRKMVINNYDFIAWRQALLTALIVLLPIVYFSYQRLPDFYEFLIISSIVFFGIYLSSIWIWTHFFYPNGKAIEKSLLKLRDKLTDTKKIKKNKDLLDFSDLFKLII